MTFTLVMILAWYGHFHSGESFEHAGRYQEAAVEFEAALRDAQILQVPVTLNNLGVVYRTLGRPHDAEVCYRRAIAFYEPRPDLATALATTVENLAALHLDQGHLSKAAPLYLRSYEIRVRALPANDPAIAQSLQGMASLEHLRKRPKAAEEYYRRALAIQESAPTLHNLATLLAEAKRDAEARPLLERALAIYQQRPGHPDSAVILRRLAELDVRAGDPARASAEFEAALEICQLSLPPGHPQTRMILQAYEGFLKSRANYTIDAASLKRSK